MTLGMCQEYSKATSDASLQLSNNDYNTNIKGELLSTKVGHDV
jgi:hypothetical protein